MKKISKISILAGLALGYFLTKKLLTCSQCNLIDCECHHGGMKVGANPSEIDLTPHFGDGNEPKRDVVDQASLESMDCSDPPAY